MLNARDAGLGIQRDTALDDAHEPRQVVWTHCQKCKQNTKHDVIHQVALTTDPDEDGYPPFTYLDCYQIVSCRGCDHHSFRVGWKIDDEEEDWSWTNFPEKSTDRKPASHTMFVPRTVRALYLETLSAKNARADILASAGLRATVEAICTDRGLVKGDLKAKIDALFQEGILPKNNAEYLHQLRFLGNDAVHDMVAAPKEEFDIALEILEHLLQSLYELPRRAKNLVNYREGRGAQVQ